MAVQFHTLTIQEVIRETEDASSIVFNIPESLKSEFQYKPGQYLTLQLFIQGERFRRAYSLSSSPVTEDKVQVTTKRVEGGKVSNFLNDFAEPGLEIEVMPPMGNFVVEPDASVSKTYVLLAGGSGVTPSMSILKSVLHGEPASKVILLYGNRDKASIIFHEELQQLQEKYSDRLQVVHTLENAMGMPDAYEGRMDRPHVKELISKHVGPAHAHAEYYICGPSAMMREIDLALEDKLIDKSHIHKEHFTSALDIKDTAESGPTEEVKEAEVSGDLSFPVKAKIILDGDEMEIEINEEDTVLEAAMEAGIDPPFACQIGACSTCRAKLREGKVSMDEREALTDEEIEEGYVLTCQSHPLTNRLVVDYDG